MTVWIDLNAPPSRPSRKLTDTLCESRIARKAQKAVGTFARSGFASRIQRAISSFDWETKAMQIAPVAYFMAGMALAALVGWMRPVG